MHFPAGAVPKDGPSAGITMTTALVSLLTGRPVRREVGMTGEVTLSGRVLPIGGVKQKVLAAHRAGLTEVILPARNGPDLDDLPDEVREAMTVHLVDDVVRGAGWPWRWPRWLSRGTTGGVTDRSASSTLPDGAVHARQAADRATPSPPCFLAASDGCSRRSTPLGATAILGVDSDDRARRRRTASSSPSPTATCRDPRWRRRSTSRCTRPGGFDGPVRIAVDQEYLRMWDENGLVPAPRPRP